ncbi:pilus assembly protein PilP [Endozoicomonas montiporae]|uniref:Pilus assembly protein PilP n=2 Tax=Endozoicomonas montiporae TaxID=1027273 RepID=A0A081N4B0_9GAMM|nr:type 4a pilus biogenesis protein PilO [Endozoicomonas montiporae]AMO57876.1 type 4 fimbrial biogenesis protein PilO [Endozoicomonas montiporae CL-33]KEQ13283.1 pilus assembly protein PilP [Endozoicomonas montiporae]
MSIADSFKKLNEINLSEFDVSELDLENVGSWPLPVRVTACVLVFILVVFLGYQFHLRGFQTHLDREIAKEEELKEQFRVKAFQAANLGAYREQMRQMEESFGALVKQLPSDTEVPGLLEDITFTGRGAGLQFEAIKLQPEKISEFYIELPISITVKGNYHDLGSFVSGVASLPRIVTLHDFAIDPSSGGSVLKMDILARTYRYNDREAE